MLVMSGVPNKRLTEKKKQLIKKREGFSWSILKLQGLERFFKFYVL